MSLTTAYLAWCRLVEVMYSTVWQMGPGVAQQRRDKKREGGVGYCTVVLWLFWKCCLGCWVCNETSVFCNSIV
jgi:hypothetical protein